MAVPRTHLAHEHLTVIDSSIHSNIYFLFVCVCVSRRCNAAIKQVLHHRLLSRSYICYLSIYLPSTGFRSVWYVCVVLVYRVVYGSDFSSSSPQPIYQTDLYSSSSPAIYDSILRFIIGSGIDEWIRLNVQCELSARRNVAPIVLVSCSRSPLLLTPHSLT